MYKLKNKKEIKAIYEEMITSMSYENFLKLLEYVFDKQYNWLLIDRDNNIYYKNFNQLIINNNDK